MSKPSSSSAVSMSNSTNLEHLPDEVLVRILSLLTVNEAARTSVLSHRWENLWRLITRIVFDKRLCYIRVDRVLSLHECPFLDELRFKFELSTCLSSKVDEWIVKFFIPKRVKCLEIYLSEYCCCDSYFFYECFRRSTSLSKLPEVNGLTSLTLKGNYVDGPVIESLLQNCPHLEFLSVLDTDNLVNLKVAGPCVQLKHLEISECSFIESIEICAPKLVTLSIEYRVSRRGEYRVSHYSGESIEFRVGENPNLKTLILDVAVDRCDSLIGLIGFIEAAPLLHRLTLKLSLRSSGGIQSAGAFFVSASSKP